MNTEKYEAEEKVVIALPKELVWDVELEGRIKNYPWSALPEARTYKEVFSIIDSITAGNNESSFSPDNAESLIKSLSLRREDVWFDYLRKMTDWYIRTVCNKGETARIIRAFRFTMSYWYESVSMGGCPIKPYLCHWDDEPINKAVKKYPWLYWCHKRYQRGIERTLENFLECHADPSRPYSDLDWQGVERAIRRIVSAEDPGQLEIISQILSLHREGKMKMRKEDMEKDQFFPGRITSFLKDTHRFLGDRSREDRKKDPQKFGLFLKKQGELQGSVFVEVDFPKEIIARSNGTTDPVPLKIKIRTSNEAEKPKLLKLLAQIHTNVTLEGGLFIEKERGLVDGFKAFQAFPLELDGGCEFSFISFEGRHRLNVSLGYTRGHEDINFICNVIYFEVKQPEVEKKPA